MSSHLNALCLYLGNLSDCREDRATKEALDYEPVYSMHHVYHATSSVSLSPNTLVGPRARVSDLI
jgi:hypothetical protein